MFMIVCVYERKVDRLSIKFMILVVPERREIGIGKRS